MLLAIASAAGFAKDPPRDEFTVRRDPGGWTVRYAPGPLRTTTVEIDGTPHLLFTGASASVSADPGQPQLPLESISFGVPADAVLTAELLEPVYEQDARQYVAPVPSHARTGDEETVTLFEKNRDAYRTNRMFPGRELWTDPPFRLRGQTIATIHLAPVQYNPSTLSLRRLVGGRIRVQVTPAQVTPASRGKSPPDPFFEEVFKGLLVNYEEAREWRTVAVQNPSAADPLRDWFVTGRTYYRVPVVSDAWVRLRRADLPGGGWTAGDTASLALFVRGKEIPISVRGDSAIEFYGERNRGDSTLFDFYTDTSAYWLTWGGPPGRRYSSTGEPAGSPVVQRNSALATVHAEENTDYYEGSTDPEIMNPAQVPGEGWVWEYYYPNSQYTHSFLVDSLDQNAPTATCRVRLFGTTTNSTHKARFWVNDSLVGEVSFGTRSEGRFTSTFPASWLHPGTNTLRVFSDTQELVNQFYLDWFEIDYARALRASGNQIVFTTPASPGGIPVSHTVSGLSGGTIGLFDLSSGRRIAGGTVIPDGNGHFSLTFQDTLSVPRTYAVVGEGGTPIVLPSEGKTFKDIRVNAAGADYVIIAHRSFLAPAQQLAAFRQATNSVRTAVIDIQDIYDEFNYGQLNAEKIKDFTRYAFTHWPGAPPAYLLFMGDASWDYHRYMATTIKTNFVPGYGVPATDNWFGCFDPAFPIVPSLLIGRLPVQDPIQAQRTVAKIIAYESSQPAEWVKSFLFISGGTTPGEKIDFNAKSDASINLFVLPAPVGGAAYKVYKTTPNTIDGENKQLMRDIIKSGVVFLNFLGHSGGRIWGVDIGSPNDLENTTGRLPFVSSVSCNVGAFAEPSNNVLSEDFMLADNRGAIGVWSSSTLGFVSTGWTLVNYFLQTMRSNGVRTIGALTSTARLQLFQSVGTPDYITGGAVNMSPLLGDPLTRLALPVKPDLAVATGDLSLSSPLPSANDSALTVSVIVHNYGLVPADSVAFSLADQYHGVSTPLLQNMKLAPVRVRDSVAVRWRGTANVGQHLFQATVDPGGLIDEVTEGNNTASLQAYVYANLLSVIRPLPAMVVPPGPVLLRVSGPLGLDSLNMQVTFELDTISSFSSPFKKSAVVSPGPVSAEWTTPSLAAGPTYWWRGRTSTASVDGAWTTSLFSVSPDVPSLPQVRWREHTPAQFLRGTLRQTAVTDSGVTIAANTPISLYARSLGYRADANRDYYSMLQANQQSMSGYWWVHGNGFLGMRVNDFTGTVDFQAFNTPGQVVQAESLAQFIGVTPPGNYIGLSVIYDGSSNVTPALRAAIKSLGSTLIDSVKPGDAWSMLARKPGNGTPAPPEEHWSASGTTAESLQVANYYGAGSGSITAHPLPIPQRWGTFRWSPGGAGTITNERIAILGIRGNGSVDTLRRIPRDSTTVNLSGLEILTADPAYAAFSAAAILSSTDALVTPVLRDWSADFEPAADLAVSGRTLSAPKIALAKGTAGSVTLSVYNIGYRTADSGHVVLSLMQGDAPVQTLATAPFDSIPTGSSRVLHIPFDTQGLPAQFTIQARVVPAVSSRDLLNANNATLYGFVITGVKEKLSARVRMFSDGVQIMDGDYVAPRPTVVVRLSDLVNSTTAAPRVDLFVDNEQVLKPGGGVELSPVNPVQSPEDDLRFSPVLSPGTHELRVRIAEVDGIGKVDSITHRVTVNVLAESRILQMLNYPNPLQTETWFTFILTGVRPPDELTIRIFTVTGRKIREMVFPAGLLQLGFNRIHWDARDAEGDELANGYYFYQISLRAAGKTDSAIGKLVKLR
jgi:hypothetical protein